MAKIPLVAPPKEALPVGESNRYLVKFKSSLSKRWSSTRMEVLYEISDLALFLWALNRNKEALAVAASIVRTIPSPPPLRAGGFNYNVWCPATVLHGLVIRLSPETSFAENSRVAILGDSGVSKNNPGYIADVLADAHRVADEPAEEDTIKWYCMGIARALGSMVLYSELAKAGDTHFMPHEEVTDLIIPKLLLKLETRLRSVE